MTQRPRDLLSSGRLTAAVAASSTGDGVVAAVTPLLAASLSPGASFVGIAQFCARLPWLIISIPAGRATDRRGPPVVSFVGSVTRCCGLAALACASIFHSAAGLLVAAFLYVGGQVMSEVATQTAIIEFPAPDRPRINGNYNAAQIALGQFAGPTLGGFLKAFGSLYYIGGVALSQVVAGLLLGPWWTSGQYIGHDHYVGSSTILSGFRPLWVTRGLRLTTTVGAISMLAYGAWSAVFVLYVTRPTFLGESSAVYGLLLGVPALGVVTGTCLMPKLLARGGGRLCLWSTIGGQVGLYAPGAASLTVWWVVAGLLAYGLGLSGWNTAVLAYRQATVPAAVYGRATAAYRLVSWGASPLGALGGGTLAAALGVRAVLMAGLLLVAVQALIALIPTDLKGFHG